MRLRDGSTLVLEIKGQELGLFQDLAAWARLQRLSVASLVLRFGVALTGTALLNVS